jgi:hypothetical protein
MRLPLIPHPTCSPAGLTLEGYTTQAAFLSANGIDRMLQGAARDAAGITLAQQAKRLLLPGEMGERFRVMGLSRALGPARAGFGLVDLANQAGPDSAALAVTIDRTPGKPVATSIW